MKNQLQKQITLQNVASVQIIYITDVQNSLFMIYMLEETHADYILLRIVLKSQKTLEKFGVTAQTSQGDGISLQDHSEQVQDIQLSLKEIIDSLSKIDFTIPLKSISAQNQDHNNAVIDISQKSTSLAKRCQTRCSLLKKRY